MKKFIFLFLLLSASGFYYYHKNNKSSAEDYKNQYVTQKITRGDIAQNVLATGILQAEKLVNVGAQVSGEISALYVKVGDYIKQGDKIAEIDARSQRNLRFSAAATLEASKANLQQAKIKLNESEKTYQRHLQLSKSGAVSKEALSSSESAFKIAQANLKRAEAEVEQSQLHLNNADLNLTYTSVNSPLDGVIVSVAVEQGNTVNAVQSSPVLVSIAQTQTMIVNAEIAEADILLIKPGMETSFSLLSASSPEFKGKIKSINPAPKQNSNDTAVYYYAKIEAPNPENLLRIGMTANVSITINEAKSALLVPLTALQDDGKILVMRNGEALPVEVKTGITDGINIEILQGLNEGDEVVISRNLGQEMKFTPPRRM